MTKLFYITLTALLFILSTLQSLAQSNKILPNIDNLYNSIDTYYNKIANIQINEITETDKHRFLAYVPNVGYSPFLGGVNLSLNLGMGLQEIRKNHQLKAKKKAIIEQHLIMAKDLKNSITADYYAIQQMKENNDNYFKLDSLQALQVQLIKTKYSKNEITPTELIIAMKANENYTISRKQQHADLKKAIIQILYKSKMDATTNDIHLNF